MNAFLSLMAPLYSTRHWYRCTLHRVGLTDDGSTVSIPATLRDKLLPTTKRTSQSWKAWAGVLKHPSRIKRLLTHFHGYKQATEDLELSILSWRIFIPEKFLSASILAWTLIVDVWRLKSEEWHWRLLWSCLITVLGTSSGCAGIQR